MNPDRNLEDLLPDWNDLDESDPCPLQDHDDPAYCLLFKTYIATPPRLGPCRKCQDPAWFHAFAAKRGLNPCHGCR